ncbi:MAG: type II secretion system GspH family protein [Gammaproteobacteria bacterium]|nr:type II secretion system GspH family protein [Gammaproteobacteria bacterium]
MTGRLARPHRAVGSNARRCQVRGFTLLELVVVIAIIGVLIAVAANRLLPYMDEAERVAVLRVEGQLRSSLVMEAAQRIVRGQSASISELEGSNPVKFLLEPPKNYVGELQKSEIGQAPTRHWYFEQDGQRLVYRLGEPFGLPVRDASLQDPAFVVRVAFADTNGNQVFEADRDELYGVRLQRVAGAEWLSGATRQ